MAETEAVLSPEFFGTILAQLPFGLMVLAPTGTILACNPAAQAILQGRYGWTGAAGWALRSLPWEIQTGVKHLAEVARRMASHRLPPSLTLTSEDVSLHLSWLFPPERTGRRRPTKGYVMVVLQARERSLPELWERRPRLTPREQEVLHWLARGKSRKEISAILKVGEATVDTHLEHLYAKLGVTNKVEAVATALQAQLVERLMQTLGLS